MKLLVALPFTPCRASSVPLHMKMPVLVVFHPGIGMRESKHLELRAATDDAS